MWEVMAYFWDFLVSWPYHDRFPSSWDFALTVCQVSKVAEGYIRYLDFYLSAVMLAARPWACLSWVGVRTYMWWLCRGKGAYVSDLCNCVESYSALEWSQMYMYEVPCWIWFGVVWISEKKLDNSTVWHCWKCQISNMRGVLKKLPYFLIRGGFSRTWLGVQKLLSCKSDCFQIIPNYI